MADIIPLLIVNQHQSNYTPIYPRYSKITGFLFANSSYSWFYDSGGGFGECELKASAVSPFHVDINYEKAMAWGRKGIGGKAVDLS